MTGMTSSAVHEHEYRQIAAAVTRPARSLPHSKETISGVLCSHSYTYSMPYEIDLYTHDELDLCDTGRKPLLV